MQIVRHEPVFQPYYHISHTFPPSQVHLNSLSSCVAEVSFLEMCQSTFYLSAAQDEPIEWLQVSIAADTDWESTVTPEATDFNTATWQNLKDKNSPKSKRKVPGSNKKTFNGKESPKRDIRTTQRDDQIDWRRR